MLFDKFQDIPQQELEDLFQDFQKIMKKERFKKNHVLHHENSICKHLYLIEKGVARAFYFKDGKDVTAHFATEGGTITAIDSFIQNKKSRYNIELLEDSYIISISRNNLNKLLTEKPIYEKYVRLFLEQIYIDLAERVEDLLFNTATERYTRLVNTHPTLLQRVNLSYIASYIGITQETLSRIRAKS